MGSSFWRPQNPRIAPAPALTLLHRHSLSLVIPLFQPSFCRSQNPCIRLICPTPRAVTFSLPTVILAKPESPYCLSPAPPLHSSPDQRRLRLHPLQQRQAPLHRRHGSVASPREPTQVEEESQLLRIALQHRPTRLLREFRNHRRSNRPRVRHQKHASPAKDRTHSRPKPHMARPERRLGQTHRTLRRIQIAAPTTF
jgi:hypothetical protein